MGCYDRCFASSLHDLKSPNLYKSLLGEMLGTMFLVLFGCSSPYGESLSATVDLTRISLTFGLTVATMVWILADTSGGHVNPAVSTGMFIARKISLVRFISYVVFQLVGGIIGSAIQMTLTCDWQEDVHDRSCQLGMTKLGTNVSEAQGFGIELLITFVLVMTVFATCDKSRSDLGGSGPLAIGIAVTIAHLAFAPLTGVSMNTARTFGPAVVLGDWEAHWVYWVGPITGGCIAALLYEFVFAGNVSREKFMSWLVDSDYDQPQGNQADQQKSWVKSPITSVSNHKIEPADIEQTELD